MFQVSISKLNKTETLEHGTPSKNPRPQPKKTKQSLPKNQINT